MIEDNKEINNTNNDQENKLQACQNELQSSKDSFLRLTADFENFKKRIEKEKINWIIICQSDIFNDLLSIVDDFDRAFTGYKKGENPQLDNWLSGFELIHKSLHKLLDKYQVTQIKDFSVFNPEIHEAISQIESASHKSGEIISVEQKGYLLKDRLLRPARVTVAK